MERTAPWSPASLALATWMALLAACGGSGGGGADPPGLPEGRSMALAVSRPGELAAYVQERLRQRETSGGAPGAAAGGDMVPVPTAAAAPPPRSGTTLQEAGVDEPDLLQSDGQHFYAVDATQAQPLLRVYRRAADGQAVALKSLALATDDAVSADVEGMVLDPSATVLAAVSQRWHRSDEGGVICADICPAGASTLMPMWMRSSVAVQRVDVSEPGAASAGERISIDGQLVASRRIGDTLVLVTSWLPRLPVDMLPAGASAAERAQAIARTSASDVLPRMRRNGGAAGPLLSDTDCWTQPANGSTQVQVTTITLLDLRTPSLASRSRCFVGGTEALYMTTSSLYLATTRWVHSSSGSVTAYPAEVKTDIHKFAFAGGELAYRATGEVTGHLGWSPALKSYRLSEWNGDLRVVTYTASLGWVAADNLTAPASPAQLTVLRERPSDQTLQPVATLPNARRPEPLGKPGEQVYAVRFVGERGYVVTFRTIDPLYVLDLSNPGDPRVAGALEVPGVSDQLFPLAGGLLLGVGRDVNEAGRLGGVKVALFDTADPAQPRQVDSVSLGGTGSSTALDQSPHGLNWLTLGGVARVALPVSLATTPQGSSSTYWKRGLQRFEVDLAARRLRTLNMVGADSDGAMGGGWVGHDRSLQVGEMVYHLRGSTLTGYAW
jgi:Beta propeller domain